MKILNCIIVDDEKKARDVLGTLLKNYFPNIKVLDYCKNLLEAVDSIKKLEPNVVFLDVQMPNYAGYEIAQFFDEMNFEIVFVTAFDDYAIKAFELSAIDYLVKPINRNRLRATLTRIYKKRTVSDGLKYYKKLLTSIQNDTFESIILPEQGNRRLIMLSDIEAIEASGSYAIIHLIDRKKITSSKNLKYFENLLNEDNGFFRSHRGWIVNLKQIVSVNKTQLILIHRSGLHSSLARRKLTEFIALFISND